jgi:TctA family transporter
VALRFGPPEYFALMVLAFTTVSAVLGSSAAARHDCAVRSAWRSG